jgi:3-hydroxyisobutyrate dehydrogenase-like beta-hydroxyacid dehydrogenase
LTNEDAVQDISSGPSGLIAGLDGGVHLSVSTLAPDAAARLAELHVAGNCRYLSAPVQGRPVMAEGGQLVAWVSGPAFDAGERSVVDAIARKTIYLGDDVRHAAAAKLALNMLMNANIELFAEAFAYLGSRGVDRGLFGEGVTESAFAAPLFRAIVAGLSREDDTAGGSDVRVSRKDLGLLVADVRGIDLPVTRALEAVYARAEARGWGSLDPTSVRRLFAEVQ